MNRLFFLFALLLAVGAGPARAAEGIPPRPKPFTFVTDQAGLLQPADAKKLDAGLRRYADANGTQVVVVTVPSLGGQNVNEFARQLGTAWGVGQQGKDNGLVVLVSGQDHKLSIEPGKGLSSTVTPAVIRRAIGQMTPAFKQNNYFAGLRTGLNTLMAAANPGSAPAGGSGAAATGGNAVSSDGAGSAAPASSRAMSSDEAPTMPAQAAPDSGGGIGFGTILIGLVVIGGGIWLVSRLFRRNSNNTGGGQTTFYPNQNQPQGGQPNFYPNQGQPGGGYGYGAPQSSGPGIGGMLATGAAAAAGAYLGNRMAEGHSSGSGSNFSGNDTNYDNTGAGAAAGAGTGAADDYFGGRGGNDGGSSGPDYFSGDNASDNSGDYFSGGSDYDAGSSDSGGGGFDDSSDNSGSW